MYVDKVIVLVVAVKMANYSQRKTGKVSHERPRRRVRPSQVMRADNPPTKRLSQPTINTSRHRRDRRDSSAVTPSIVIVIVVLIDKLVQLLRVSKVVHHTRHLIVLLAQFLEPAVLLELLGREAGVRLVDVVALVIDVHGAAAGASAALALQLDLVGGDDGDLLLRLAERHDGDLVLVLASVVMAAVVEVMALLVYTPAAPLHPGHVDVAVVVARVLGRVVVPRVGGLGLGDLHGARALLLGEVQVRLVPLDAGVRLLGGVGDGRGAAALSPRDKADGPGGRRGAPVARVDLGVVDGELLLRDPGVVQLLERGGDGVGDCGGGGGVVGGGGGRSGRGFSVRVLKDAFGSLGIEGWRGVGDGTGFLES